MNAPSLAASSCEVLAKRVAVRDLGGKNEIDAIDTTAHHRMSNADAGPSHLGTPAARSMLAQLALISGAHSPQLAAHTSRPSATTSE
jgi:hypothetical protein